MLTEEALKELIPLALAGVDIPELGEKIQGKVRDIYRRQRNGRLERILVTTDRLSAFDRVLGLVPYKGQVLTQLSAFWFEQTADVIGNHLIDLPDPNVTIAYECQALPVEVVVRGYITGVTKTALWYRYSLGERVIYGHPFPEGLQKNQPLPQPIITPTTKGGPTGQDERLTCVEVVEKGLLDRPTWAKVQEAALEIFRRGQEIAARAGLILVDTKYEFGRRLDGEVVLIDEVHTPDSSRFWRADSYESRLAAGEEPENFDKEFIRLWYAGQGYRGDGEPPAWDSDLAVKASLRYQQVYEILTGQMFKAGSYPADKRIRAVLLR
jgi:phosphoribosylaminoimidazole-succinocarboxamide synthase